MRRSNESSVSWSTKITFHFEREENQVHFPRLLDGKANSNLLSQLMWLHFVLSWRQPCGQRGRPTSMQLSARAILHFVRDQKVDVRVSTALCLSSGMSHVALLHNYVLRACPPISMRSSRPGIFSPSSLSPGWVAS